MATHSSRRLDLKDFLALPREVPLIDVRTHEEYEIGHIPGAISLELFDSTQRAAIGKIYKSQGKDFAVKKGLDFISPRISRLLEEVEAKVDGEQVAVHCWRGGMRSESFAWLISFALNKDTFVLNEGYKAYRNFVLSTFLLKFDFVVLGGYTGSAKTKILHELKNRGQQVLDLESLANHRGSAFGSIGLDSQPSQQLFENEASETLRKFDLSKPIWVEDESRRIGHRIIPHELFNSIKTSRHLFIEIPFEERVSELMETYGTYSTPDLIASTSRLEKRLGLEKTKECIDLLSLGDIRAACEILLRYYDKSYSYGLAKNAEGIVSRVELETIDIEGIAEVLESKLKERTGHGQS